MNFTKDKLLALIAKDKISQVLSELEALIPQINDGDLRDNILIASANHEQLRNDVLRGIINGQDVGIKKNQIIVSLIEIIDKIEITRSKKFLTNKIDFYTPSAIDNYKKNYIASCYQNKIPDETSIQNSHKYRKDLSERFLKSKSDFDKEESKFFFILGDAGMGKSTFIVNFHDQYSKKSTYWGLVPKYDTLLVWLGHSEAFDYIKSIPLEKKENTILLLDALDEDSDLIDNDKYESRIKELVEQIIKFKKIIITTRVQFFDEKKEKIFKTYLPKLSDGGGDKKTRFGLEKLYISFFTLENIREYLLKKFGSFSSKVSEALKLVESQHGIFHRPLILKNIEILMSSEKKYTYSYEIYEFLIITWINRETRGEEELNVEVEMLLKVIAKHLYINNKGSHGGTSESISSLLAPYSLELSDIEEYCKSFITKNIDGLLDFSHKSFFEYYLALNLIEDDNFRKGFDFTGFDFTYILYKEIIFEKHLKPFFLINEEFEIELFLNNGRYIKLNRQTLLNNGDSLGLFKNEKYNFMEVDFNNKLLDKISLIYFNNFNYTENGDFKKILLSCNSINLDLDFSVVEFILQKEINQLQEEISKIEYNNPNAESLVELRRLVRRLTTNKRIIKNKFNQSRELCKELLSSQYLIY